MKIAGGPRHKGAAPTHTVRGPLTGVRFRIFHSIISEHQATIIAVGGGRNLLAHRKDKAFRTE
jgi:hypothetical protein